MRLFVFYFSYPLATNNHAGMPHFAQAIAESFACEVFLYNGIPSLTKRFFRCVNSPKDIFFEKIATQLQSGDKLLFLEYLGSHEATYQTELLSFIRQRGLKNHTTALLHLPFKIYLENFTPTYIDKALSEADRIVVYGSSLASDLRIWGVGSKVVTTFHYVDDRYFLPITEKDYEGPLNVIIWGNTFRNIATLRYIVNSCPEIKFDFCIGKKPYHSLLTQDNVEVHEYLEENDLLNLLLRSHVNLSVMYDTVGSNVTVISKSCGLVNVVSDIGSIRDYCDVNDSFLCIEPEEFIFALKKLNSDRITLRKMAQQSLADSKYYSLQRSLHNFKEILFKFN